MTSREEKGMSVWPSSSLDVSQTDPHRAEPSLRTSRFIIDPARGVSRDPANGQRTDPNTLDNAICNGHPRDAGGEDLSRRYYERELRSVSFPGK
jgi:hypothetical protein